MFEISHLKFEFYKRPRMEKQLKDLKMLCNFVAENLFIFNHLSKKN